MTEKTHVVRKANHLDWCGGCENRDGHVSVDSILVGVIERLPNKEHDILVAFVSWSDPASTLLREPLRRDELV